MQKFKLGGVTTEYDSCNRVNLNLIHQGLTDCSDTHQYPSEWLMNSLNNNELRLLFANSHKTPPIKILWDGMTATVYTHKTLAILYGCWLSSQFAIDVANEGFIKPKTLNKYVV